MVDILIGISQLIDQSTLHIITPAGLCLFTYMLLPNRYSEAYNPNGCRLCMLRVLSYHNTSSHNARYTIYHLVGVKCIARGINLLQRCPEKFRTTSNFSPPSGLKPTAPGIPD